MVYHPNSPYGKLQEIINSGKCICGNTKKNFKPFCFSCFEDLTDRGFQTSGLYRNGEGGLEKMMDAIEELSYKGRL